MDSINRLIELFSEFPGIGPRQARRFVYHLLRRNAAFLDDLSKNIAGLKGSIGICSSCHQFFQKKNPSQTLCPICSDASRDVSKLLIVSYDSDLEHIEKSGAYRGMYFVLGGTVPILAPDPDQKIRSRELSSAVSARAKKGELKEIILGMNATPEGDNTGEYITTVLSPIVTPFSIKISHLGRGISTGTEIEYSDKETLRNALENRK